MPAHIGTPRLYIDEALLERGYEDYPNKIAVAGDNSVISYAELHETSQKIAEALSKYLKNENCKIALAINSKLDYIRVFFGALKTRHEIVLFESKEESDLIKWLYWLDPELFIAVTDNKAIYDLLLNQKFRVINSKELTSYSGTNSVKEGFVDIHDPAIAIPTPNNLLAYHSHYTILSGIISFLTFMEVEKESVFLVNYPFSTWEGLYSVLIPLYMGGTAVLTGDSNFDYIAELIECFGVNYFFLNPKYSIEILKQPLSKFINGVKRNCKLIFIPVYKPFNSSYRKKLRKLFGKPILTVYGYAETGPIVASHPSWYIDEAIGTPITNAELRPVDPDSKEPVDIPWELLEYAAIDVKAPYIMLGYNSEDATKEKLRGKWFFTGDLAIMDANGMFYLLGKNKEE